MNDAPWLLAQLDQVEQEAEESERLRRIDLILHRQDPGPAGFYADCGSPESWQHVVSVQGWTEDPGSLASPRVSFGVGLRGRAVPRAWMRGIICLYDEPLEMIYQPLDARANYTLRVSYTGRLRSKMKLVADEAYTIHDFVRTGLEPTFEFELPREAVADGAVRLKWTCGEGERGSQVSEIWLIRKQEGTR